MKKIFFLLLLLGYSCLVQAQTDNVYISVAMPSDCTLDGNTKSILKNLKSASYINGNLNGRKELEHYAS